MGLRRPGSRARRRRAPARAARRGRPGRSQPWFAAGSLSTSGLNLFLFDANRDSVDLSVSDLNKEIALRLGERSSQVVADIDQALLRMKEGNYGICVRCGESISERRLEAVPTARYDAQCQTIIESANGEDDFSTL
jgi:DnaK suppressor protein